MENQILLSKIFQRNAQDTLFCIMNEYNLGTECEDTLTTRSPPPLGEVGIIEFGKETERLIYERLYKNADKTWLI